MKIDQIYLIIGGAIYLIFGIGLIFAKSDKSSREKDEKRFGTLPNISMGGWYFLGQHKRLNYFIIYFFILLGLIFVVAGLRQL
jgi:hypothetical protein